MSLAHDQLNDKNEVEIKHKCKHEKAKLIYNRVKDKLHCSKERVEHKASPK